MAGKSKLLKKKRLVLARNRLLRNESKTRVEQEQEINNLTQKINELRETLKRVTPTPNITTTDNSVSDQTDQSDYEIQVEYLDDTQKNNLIVPAEPAPVKQRTEISYEGLSLTELQRKAEQMQKEALAHCSIIIDPQDSSEGGPDEPCDEPTEPCEEVAIPIETVNIVLGEDFVFKEEIEDYEYEE